MSQRTDITINVPLRTGTFASPEPEEIKRIVISETRLNISTLFDVIGLVGVALENKEIEPFDAAASIRLLADLGEGLTESLGASWEDNPKAYEIYPEPAEPEKVLDLSAHESPEDGCINLAKDVNAAIFRSDNPDFSISTQHKILGILGDAMKEKQIEWSPELVEALLCNVDDDGETATKLTQIINGGKQ